MTVPAFPVLTAVRVQRRLEAAVAYERSPYTFVGQSYDWGGRAWSYNIDLGVVPGASGKALSAFLAALGGPATVFTFRDPTAKNAGAGTITVNGGSQTGTSLDTSGWTTAPEVGDFFSLGSGSSARLHQITAVSGSTPDLALTIAPGLRSSPADNDPVEIAAPIVALRLAGPVPIDAAPSGVYRVSLQANEAL